MAKLVRIGSRFHGPPASGNGGYSCGLIAKHMPGVTAVRLRIPPPLEKDMDLRPVEKGMALFDGDDIVATAFPTTIDIEVPTAPGFIAAKTASDRFRGFESHYYPGCFVCGPDRRQGDGLRIFAGPVETGTGPRGMVATTWVPDESLTEPDGSVASEYIWAALDCPGAYSFPEPRDGAILLGELAVDIRHAIKAGDKCVLIGWEVEQTGRKHHTGTALFDNSGRCCAVGFATWIEVPVKPG